MALPTLDHSDWRFKVNIPLPYSRKCLVFTGASSQYVDLGDVLGFERTDARTISFWAKWTAASTMTFIGKMADSTAFTGWQVSCTTEGKVEFYLINDWGGANALAVNTTSSSFNNGAWRHIVITYDGTSAPGGCRIYIDGTNQALTTVSNTLSASIITSANLWLGGRESASSHQYYTGSMDEVSIWNIAMTAAQVTALYDGKDATNLLIWTTPPPANLIGWWRMGDGDTAPTITDNSTGGHDGTMVNSPVITADWPTSGNYVPDYQSLLLNIKNALTTSTGWTDGAGAPATVTSPWTVVASSNGVVANTSDNWNSIADMVTSGGAHSWIVLQQAATGFQICLDCNNTYFYQLSVAVTFGASFNVSSPITTARPTSPDEVVFWSGLNWFNSSTSFGASLNVQMTADGAITRYWGLVGGVCKMFFGCETAKNPVSGWTVPTIAYWAGATGMQFTNWNDNAYTNFRANNQNGAMYMSSEFYIDGAIGQRQTTVNSLSGEWPMNRIGLAGSTPGLYGRHGEVSDMWWGSTTPATGDTYPSTGTLKQFYHNKDMIVPWNQSVPLLT